MKEGGTYEGGTTDKISNDENAIKYYLGNNFRI